jgi:hypothetical protein
MRKIREVLRLRADGLSEREIARSVVPERAIEARNGTASVQNEDRRISATRLSSLDCWHCAVYLVCHAATLRAWPIAKNEMPPRQ